MIKTNDRSAKKMFGFFYRQGANFWMERGQKHCLKFFHEASQLVPAYKIFLDENKVNAEKIKTWEDFQKIPVINKKNYLSQHPWPELCWEDSFKNTLVFTSTSGSTGEPYYFPRSRQLDWQSSIFHELFLRYGKAKENGPTLIVIAFGMGVWIGGLITYKAFEICAERGNYPVSLITPGINKKEIFSALKRLSPHYAQTIIAGYPPFVKDLIDEAKDYGVDLKKLNLRFVFAAETFTEGLRDYLVKKAGINSLYKDFFHIYGSADLGTMAVEMPLGILIKRLALKNKEIFTDLFGQIEKVPTLAQYNPFFTSFESVAGELIISGNNTLPLIRYAIGDRGGILTFGEVEKILNKHGVNLKKEAERAEISDCLFQLPFVYVYERVDLSATIYGLNIYPQVIKEALLQESLEDLLSGKFTMSTKFDENHNQYLEINLEVKKNINPKEIDEITKSNVLNRIVSHLILRSSEFKELKQHLGERAYPRLVFWETEHPIHFKPGVKQRWVDK